MRPKRIEQSPRCAFNGCRMPGGHKRRDDSPTGHWTIRDARRANAQYVIGPWAQVMRIKYAMRVEGAQRAAQLAWVDEQVSNARAEAAL